VKKKLLNYVNKLLTYTINAKLVSAKKKIDLTAYKYSKRPQKPLYLNIGAGMWAHPIWHNLDNPAEGYGKSFGFKNEWKNLIQHDLMEYSKLNIDDNSLEAAYTSHVVEHLNDKANESLFNEVYRILRPGGFFRITCPDLKIFKRMYERGDSRLLAKMNSVPEGKFSNEQLFLNMFISSLSELTPPQEIDKVSNDEFRNLYLNYGCEETFNRLSKKVSSQIASKYPRNHDSWHTEKKLIRNLKQAGFSNAYSSRYLQSECEVMRDAKFFDYMHPYESLYVEAIK
jgi:ubiquinone/menaquinone biosynthesis C-methylase UbiE